VARSHTPAVIETLNVYLKLESLQPIGAFQLGARTMRSDAYRKPAAQWGHHLLERQPRPGAGLRSAAGGGCGGGRDARDPHRR